MEYNGKKILAKPNGNTYDIIQALVNITPVAIEQVKPKINELINVTGDAYHDALQVAKFIRKNVTYEADGYSNQNIQLPARMFYGTKKADCKSFSLGFVSLMKAAGHNAGYRFASYKSNKIPTHVYNWIKYNNKIYTFDCCLAHLKESPRYTYIQDMDVNYLTGSPENDFISGKKERQARRTKRREEGKGVFQKAKKVLLAAPRNAFRLIVSLNVRGLAKSLNEAIGKNKTKVKGFWEKVGGKFEGKNSLMQSIETGAKKKPLFGAKKGVTGYDSQDEEPYIGIAVEAAIASATPILIAVKKLLKDVGVKQEDVENVLSPEEETEAEDTGNKITDPNFVAEDDENKQGTGALTTGFKPSPLLIGGVVGAALLVYLLTKKKK
jgi:hypothetical protein